MSLHLVLPNGTERPLDREIIHVRPIPFVYGASFTASPLNRTLVWVCNPSDEQAARNALGSNFATYVPNRSTSRYTSTLGCTWFNHDEEVEFLRLMRSGNYNQFWILGAHHPFEFGAGDELATRVAQGDGLLVAGGDPSLDLFYWCSNQSPLGARYAGSLPYGTHTIKFAPTSALSGLDSVVTGQPTRVTTTTATVIATTTYSTWLGTKTGITATYNQFGQDKAVYIGAPPSAFTDQSRASAVLAKTATVIASSNATNRAAGLARLDLFVEGIAPGDPLELRTTLPGGSSVVQPPSDSTLIGNVFTLPFDTATNQRKDRSFWLKLPTTTGSATSQTTAYYRDPSDGLMKPFGVPATSSINVAEDKQSAKTAATSAVDAITGVGLFSYFTYQKIKDDVSASITPTTSSSTLWWRIQALVDDVGTLEHVGWGGRDAARLAIARLVTYVQYDYYKATGGS